MILNIGGYSFTSTQQFLFWCLSSTNLFMGSGMFTMTLFIRVKMWK